MALSHCVFMWKLLYLDVRPLGLQALHAGQYLLLVAGKRHAHLGQFTTKETEEKYPLMSLLEKESLHFPSNTKQLLRFYVQYTDTQVDF